MEDYYSILDVPRTASTAEIKTAFKKLSLKCHPDKQGTINDSQSGPFVKLREAWNTLGDSELRKMYDRKLADTESFQCLPIDQELFLMDMTYDKNLEVLYVCSYRIVFKADLVMLSVDYGDLYRKVCRCGGEYTLTKDDLGVDDSYVNCDSCSLCIRVIAAETTNETVKANG